MELDDLAYDGSNYPPARELTARERDILCRVLSEIISHARYNPPVFMENWTPVPIGIGEPDFFGVLWEIRKVIDPRTEK